MNMFESLKNYLLKLINFYNDELKYVLEVKYQSKEHVDIDKIVFLTLSKITKSCRAITILSQGYGEDAAIIARSIFEGLVTLAYILKEDSTNRAILFKEYDTLDYYNRLKGLYEGISKPDIKKAYEKVLEKCDIKIIEKIKKSREDIIKELKIKKVKGIKEYNWSFSTMRHLALETGYLYYYKQIYWQVSKISHSLYSSLEDFAEHKTNQMIYNDSPSDNWVNESIFLSADLYLQLLKLINNYVDLNLNKRLEDFSKEFNNIAVQLNSSV
ncbi:MAG: hypothetical protein HYW86_03890 [Candidatus Roizmanbacteria bacterium]|nr:MAG: hypothetical protein HYW86_03890 [Candidatus Roizmanbacteria bacterium]